MSPRVANAEKRYRISLLLDAYGDLLTDKQQDFLRRYYEQDFSFGEIAREYKVSRQAIFDSVKHGEAALENYERVLGLVGSREEGRGGVRPGRLSSSALRAEAAAERLRQWAGAAEAGAPVEAVRDEAETLAEELESLAVELRRAAGQPAAEDDGEGRPMAGAGRAAGASPGALLMGDGPEVD